MSRHHGTELSPRPLAVRPSASGVRGDWSAGLLRALEWVAYPAFAGAAFVILSLGVVTWLPAWAGAAYSLNRWRNEGDPACFANAVAAFRRYLRPLLGQSIIGLVLFTVLAANIGFLAGGRINAARAGLLAGQLGLILVVAVFHLGLAVAAAIEPTADVVRWRRTAMVLGFGAPRRGFTLAVLLLAAPVVTLPIPFGPLLLGPTLPLLAGLAAARRIAAR